MKKKICVLTALIIFFLSGCGEKSLDIGHLKENLENITSMNYDLHIEIETIQKHDNTEIPVKIEYSLNNEETTTLIHSSGTITTTIDDSEKTYNVETYQSKESDQYYYKKDNIWYRTDYENENNFNMNLLKNIFNGNLEQKQEDNENEYIFEGQISGLKEIINNKDISDNANVYLKTTTEYPTYLKLDLKDSNISQDITSFSIEITFNSFNESDITLPNDIKEDSQKHEISTEETKNSETTEIIENTESSIEPIEENTEAEPIIKKDDNDSSTLTLTDNWKDFEFQYDGKTYQIPFKLNMLENSGYVSNNASTIIDSGETIDDVLYNNENKINVTIKNNSDSPKTLAESDIVKISFDTYSLSQEEQSKFIFNNKITLSSNYNNVIDKFGEASDIHDGSALKILTYKDENKTIQIYFDADTLLITKYNLLAD